MAEVTAAPTVVDQDKATQDVINEFHLKLITLSALASTQLKHAKENQDLELARLEAASNDAVAKAQRGDLNATDFAHCVNIWIDSKKPLEALRKKPQEVMLAEIIFTSIFNNFDAYLNHLLRNLYSRNQTLVKQLGGKTVFASEVMSRDRDEIIAALIDTDIDGLLRESYPAIFDRLAKTFEVGTLTNFQNWPTFVECSQRRNILTHCDGMVSKQYIQNCKDHGVRFNPVPNVGTKLSVSPEYLQQSIDVVTEAGLKLGQVLWRASCDGSVFGPDAHLGHLIFELLKREEWGSALRLGEFATQCSKRSHKVPRNERAVKIILINHAQAAKWSGDQAGALAILDGFDWSGSAPEFRFAEACLREDWNAASGFMKQMGATYDPMPVYGYVGWPICRGFRATQQFRDTFRSIFGVDFADEMTKTVEPPSVGPDAEGENHAG